MYTMADYGFESDSRSFANKRMKNNQGQSINISKPNITPSRVVHVRGLSEQVTDADLIQALQGFGTISYVMNFPQRRMALVEFENLDSAMRLVTHTRENEVPVAGMPANYNFSISDKIKRPEIDSKTGQVEMPASNVLLLTIMNARHPITVDIIHTICNPLANVVRIVIFRKNGVQVLVEFENVENATKAKNGLHGADIYANSCTIKAEYAKPTKLTVRRNDQNTWDYSVMPTSNVGLPKTKPLLADPSTASQPFGFNPLGSSLLGSGSTSGLRLSYEGGIADSFGLGSFSSDSQFQLPNCVLMIYGINMEKFNCQKLFNLLCLYGDVVKIRFLKSKEGSAMVQMAGRDSCERVTMMLRDVKVFGQNLSISNSKQAYVSESTSPSFSLPDGTNSFMDFTGSKNNRFGSPDALKKHKVQFPTKIVYFYNAPPNIEESTLLQPFSKSGAEIPLKVVMLPAKSEKSSRGYLTFPDAATATESLVAVNNSRLPNPNGPAPYVLKLAFSAATPDESQIK